MDHWIGMELARIEKVVGMAEMQKVFDHTKQNWATLDLACGLVQRANGPVGSDQIMQMCSVR